MKSETRAIHWIRSRQESRELSYWLSFVYFDTKDRSLNNRIYLVYLLVFFSVWWFVALLWFAKAGATLLTLFSPIDPTGLAIALNLLVLLVWFVVTFIQALRRSPVMFSEDDSLLTCQMPLKPQQVVARWLVMPWVKRLLPFILLALVSGFSLAEAALVPGEGLSQDFVEYARIGARSVLTIIPLHLVLLVISWALGVWFMNHQRRRKALIVVLGVFLVILLVFLSGIAAAFGSDLPAFLQPISNVLPHVLKAGFGVGQMTTPLLMSWLAVVFSLAALFLASRKFGLTLAAQESKERVKINNLQRYGFSGQAREIRSQRRLGWERKTSWYPAWHGGRSLLWKSILQYFRTINLTTVFDLLFFITSSMGLVFIPDLGGRILLILTWTLRAGQFSTNRLRRDLQHWATVKQLPISPRKWIQSDLLLESSLILLMSVIGLSVGSLLAGRLAVGELLIVPGMIGGIAGISAYEIFKNARVSLLMKGQAPGVSEMGVILGTIGAAIPVVIYSAVPGFMGAVLAVLSSLVISFVVFKNAVNTYQLIE